jgi:hypothetical protein
MVDDLFQTRNINLLDQLLGPECTFTSSAPDINTFGIEDKNPGVKPF